MKRGFTSISCYFLLMKELNAEKTNVTPQQMALALYQAYWTYFNSPPSKDTVRVLLAQWALETGWGKSMWCYNVGNAKSREGDGYDYCFFKCNEILARSVAERLLQEDPEHVQISTYRPDDTCIVWFLPKHLWCRFRAFKTLEDGVYDHLKMVVRTFDRAWPYAVAGDPEGYCQALKEQKYFTADLSVYTETLKAVFNKLDSLEVPNDHTLPLEDRQRVLNSVALSLADMVEDIYERDSSEGDDENV